MRNHVRLLIVTAAVLLMGAGCIQIQGAPSAGGADGGIWKSNDKGAHWLQKSAVASVGQPKSFGGLNVTAIVFDPSDPKAVYAGTESNGLFSSLDAGESWNHADAFGTLGVNAVAVSTEDKCVVYVATGNRVARTRDCMRTWENAYVDTRGDTRITGLVADFFNHGVVYAATSQGDLLRSTDGGDSWSAVKRFDNEIKQVLMSSRDSRVLYVVTKGKGIWKTTDAGANWTDLSPQFGSFAGSLDNASLVEDMATANALMEASNYGLLRSTDGGASWKALQLLTPSGSTVVYALAVNPKQSNEIWYGTVNTLYHTTDGGSKWTTAKLPTTRTATKLVSDPADANSLYMATTLFQKKSAF